jgi:endonuclease-3
MIKETNFNKRKAKNILTVSKLVAENGLAKNHEDLLKYPGVGVKISMIYLRVAEGVDNGIGVDTHVHRICNRLGWVDTKTPDQTEIALQALFPKNLWKGINVGLVGFGQIHCEAKKPKC